MPACSSAAPGCSRRRRRPCSSCATGSATCRTAPMPTPRSSSAASSSSTCPTSTPRSTGRRASRTRRDAYSKSGRTCRRPIRRRRGEAGHGRAPRRRAGGARFLRPALGISRRALARRGGGGRRAGRRLPRRARGVAADGRAGEAGGVAAHRGAAAAERRLPPWPQTVLGLDAARIASAFLVQPAAMGQRLSRAKAKIRDAGIAFAVPEASELAPRLDAVLEAIYAAYGSGWDDVAGADPRRKGLAVEAIELGRLLLRLLPGEPEAQGLLALMLHCQARRAARRSASGDHVPLSDQDVSLWSAPMIEEAQLLLALAERAGRIGHFQLEAAIQSMHARRAWTGRTDWETIALLYEGRGRLPPPLRPPGPPPPPLAPAPRPPNRRGAPAARPRAAAPG